jgi:hypothetical protein
VEKKEGRRRQAQGNEKEKEKRFLNVLKMLKSYHQYALIYKSSLVFPSLLYENDLIERCITHNRLKVLIYSHPLAHSSLFLNHQYNIFIDGNKNNNNNNDIESNDIQMNAYGKGRKRRRKSFSSFS